MVAAMFFMIGSAISFRSLKEREEASGSFGGLTVNRPPSQGRSHCRVPDSSNRQDRMSPQDRDKRVAIASPQRFVDRVVFIDRSGPDRRLIVSEEPDPLELCLR
jgi:hypothetical protein